MFKFFSSIASLIATVVGYIGSAISTTISVFRMIGITVAFAFKYVSSLPVTVSAIALVFISYCIIVNLLNKGS